ncbi:glycosyl hydrolase family 15 [Colletotrichum cuscutae]|uniref:Glycosyl hydrolase family 15 n=1 Tax=Colletotrichum cuscutae TaxID=1209917 RepID=A0AAI9V9Z2_9PEZI|nr:glycosyl hydrolase family 15 [Colletotrichum cuscutae]
MLSSSLPIAADEMNNGIRFYKRIIPIYIHDDGVVDVVDFFPRPKTATVISKSTRQGAFRETTKIQEELKKWLVRRVECIRGRLQLDIEIFPAFQYAGESHVTTIIEPTHTANSPSKAVTFHSEHYKMQLDVTIDDVVPESEADPSAAAAAAPAPSITFRKEKRDGMLGEGVVAHLEITEGQAVSFVLRNDKPDHVTENVTTAVLDGQQHDTQSFWYNWISKSKYKGRWREVVNRSLMLLKMLAYEPTGAIVAAPTFSIPEDIGGVRNWDYRFCWVRDSSFTIYILLRLGFSAEADAYMDFISERFVKSRGPSGELPIMFTIRGETEIPEMELDHLEGYRGSKPVRIGNGAAFHQQFDIYGELMDGIYLYNKYGKPISWDQWCSVREMLDFVLTLTDQPDMSIWEVRNKKQNFTYSKVMLWVAFDRGLRLADKRNFPCPNRSKWLEARDNLMEEIMEKGTFPLSSGANLPNLSQLSIPPLFLGAYTCTHAKHDAEEPTESRDDKTDNRRAGGITGYNKEMKCFVQSYENNTMLDSSILIAPLVFFIAPNDPRFLNTMDRILMPPEKGGLTSTGLVSRYDTELSDDGVGGREGAFSMCTFWLVEAMTRASVYEPKYLVRAVNLFENMLSFSNHLSMFSEEIARSGEQLGNTPQAFSHLALISAAFNLDRVTGFQR